LEHPRGFRHPLHAGGNRHRHRDQYAILFGALYSLEAAVNWSTWTLDTAIQKRLPAWRALGQPGGRALVDCPTERYRQT